jgi:hypothetical protein
MKATALPFVARNQEIARRLNETGDSLDKIAADYGISRERVRQIARDHFGIRSSNRPAKIAAIERIKADHARHEAERLHLEQEEASIVAQVRRMVEGERMSARGAAIRLGFSGRKEEAYVTRLAREAGIISTWSRHPANQALRERLGIKRGAYCRKVVVREPRVAKAASPSIAPKAPPRNGIPDDTRRKIFKLANQGWKTAAIGRACGIPGYKVRELLDRYPHSTWGALAQTPQQPTRDARQQSDLVAVLDEHLRRTA